MLNKKVKVLLVSFTSIFILSVIIISGNAYASSDKSPDKEVSADSTGVRKSTAGSLQAPADVSADEVTETKLDGSPILFQLTEYYNDNNGSIVEKSLGSVIEITPFSTITWPAQTINYNTRMHFTRSGSTFIIRAGVSARFEFYITSGNSSYEVGFMDKDLNVLEVIVDSFGTGASVSYTPDTDVEGYFYVWNKSAADIEVDDISLTY